jgi:hypothetical protein
MNSGSPGGLSEFTFDGGTQLNPSDTFRFLLALGLLPVLIRLGRGINLPKGREAFVFGVVAIIAAFGMQAVGRLVPWDGFRLMRHLVFGIGGFSLAYAAWQVRRFGQSPTSGGEAS